MSTALALVSPLELLKYDTHSAPYLIIDARPYNHYVAGHIPGAIWMGWEAWCEEAPTSAGETLAQAGYWGVLKDGTDGSLRETLEQCGLSNDRPVLVYADGPRSKGREGRLAWMLLYWGISSVSLLDGGWNAWLTSGGGSESVSPSPKRGQFQIRVQGQRRVQLDQLKHALQRKTLPLLIDVRSQAEFEGHCYPYQPRLGRLPGSLSMPFTELFDDAGYFVTKSVYLQRLPPQVQSANRLVAYCEVGVRSAIFALLHELYTGQIVANFDGSVMEWALDRSLPMDSGSELLS